VQHDLRHPLELGQLEVVELLIDGADADAACAAQPKDVPRVVTQASSSIERS
jgi:hypothetical protein